MALPKEYDAIERALRVARARRPSDEGPRSRAMWDAYQRDDEPYGNRPWRRTPVEDRLTDREINDLSDILGVNKSNLKDALAEGALNGGGLTLEENAGWMNPGIVLGLLQNHQQNLGPFAANQVQQAKNFGVFSNAPAARAGGPHASAPRRGSDEPAEPAAPRTSISTPTTRDEALDDIADLERTAQEVEDMENAAVTRGLAMDFEPSMTAAQLAALSTLGREAIATPQQPSMLSALPSVANVVEPQGMPSYYAPTALPSVAEETEPQGMPSYYAPTALPSVAEETEPQGMPSYYAPTALPSVAALQEPNVPPGLPQAPMSLPAVTEEQEPNVPAIPSVFTPGLTYNPQTPAMPSMLTAPAAMPSVANVVEPQGMPSYYAPTALPSVAEETEPQGMPSYYAPNALPSVAEETEPQGMPSYYAPTALPSVAALQEPNVPPGLPQAPQAPQAPTVTTLEPEVTAPFTAAPLAPEIAAMLEMEELAAAIPENVAQYTPNAAMANVNNFALQGWAQTQEGLGPSRSVNPGLAAVMSRLGISGTPTRSQLATALTAAVAAGIVTSKELWAILQSIPTEDRANRQNNQRQQQQRQQQQRQQQQRQQQQRQQQQPAPTPTPRVGPTSSLGLGPTQTASPGSGLGGPPDAKAGANIPGLIAPETRGWQGRNRTSPDQEEVGPDFAPGLGGGSGGGNSGGGRGGSGGNSGGGLGGGLGGGRGGSGGGAGPGPGYSPGIGPSVSPSGPNPGSPGNTPSGPAGPSSAPSPSPSPGVSSPDAPRGTESPSEDAPGPATTAAPSPGAPTGIGNSPAGLAPSQGFGPESEDTTSEDPDGGIPGISPAAVAAAAMSFTESPMSLYSAPNVQTALSQMTPPGMPAYASFRAAQEEGLEDDDAEESQDIENSFSTAFGNPTSFGQMGGFASGLAGTSLGAAPEGVTGSPANTEGTFGGLGLGRSAVETSQAQMSALGLNDIFGMGFNNPNAYSGLTGYNSTTTSTEDTDDTTGPGASGPSSAAEAAAAQGVDTSPSSQTDGPGATDSTGTSGSSSSGDGGGDGTSGATSGDVSGAGDSSGSGPGGGPSGGGEGGGQGGGGGAGSGGNSGPSDGASTSGGPFRRGGYIDETFDVWSDYERDRAILRALRATERMMAREQKSRGGYVMPFARFADGGEIVQKSVEYTPNGVIYSTVIERALNAAKRRRAA